MAPSQRHTLSLPETRYPFYVQVVPLQRWDDYRVCQDLRGYVVLTVYGHMVDPGGT